MRSWSCIGIIGHNALLLFQFSHHFLLQVQLAELLSPSAASISVMAYANIVQKYDAQCKDTKTKP
jgi:hypothetical protein